MANVGPEEEIVCDSNNVKIDRYDFLTLAEILAGNYAHQWLLNIDTNTGVDYRSYGVDVKAIQKI